MTKDDAERLTIQIDRVCPDCAVFIVHEHNGAYRIRIRLPDASEDVTLATQDAWWEYLKLHPGLRARTV
jgi:hypothetical protein